MKNLNERITSIEKIDDEFADKTIDEILDELLGPEGADEFEEEFPTGEEEFDIELDDEFTDDSIDTDNDDFLELEDDEEFPMDFDADTEEDVSDINLDDFADEFGGNIEADEFAAAELLPSSEEGEYQADEPAPSEEGNGGETNPNFQGVLRTVMGANLVYKRQIEDGTFEELWIYNVGDDVKSEIKTRKAILAGTDIQPGQVSSEDGSQSLETYTVGNVQYLKINGLPN